VLVVGVFDHKHIPSIVPGGDHNSRDGIGDLTVLDVVHAGLVECITNHDVNIIKCKGRMKLT